MNAADLTFLGAEDVIGMHWFQLDRFGGAKGLRDVTALESSLREPRDLAVGELSLSDLLGLAARYLFHIVRTRPFIDGNRRTGLLCALTFLALNEVELDAEPRALADLTSDIAAGALELEAAVQRFEELGLATVLRQEPPLAAAPMPPAELPGARLPEQLRPPTERPLVGLAPERAGEVSLAAPMALGIEPGPALVATSAEEPEASRPRTQLAGRSR